MIEFEQIPELCRSKDFDLLRINFRVDIDDIRDRLQHVRDSYEMMPKDGYDSYVAIGMQYADPADPLYDAVQQTAFIGKQMVQVHRAPKRYSARNEIGRLFDDIYDIFAALGIRLQRGRILEALPGHDHPKHFDNDIRVHLPVITNPECQMFYGDAPYHMPADGYFYLINGFRLHHFYNRGSEPRIHFAWIIQQELYA